MGTMHFRTSETGITFIQIVTAISKTSQAYDSEVTGFVRTYGSGSGETIGEIYSQQVQHISTCTRCKLIYCWSAQKMFLLENTRNLTKKHVEQ